MRKSEKKFEDARIEKIIKGLNELKDRFSTPKIKEIRKDHYIIENKKNLSTPKIKEVEQNLLELERNLSNLKKCYDYDDIEYRGIRDIKNSFVLSIDEDY